MIATTAVTKNRVGIPVLLAFFAIYFVWGSTYLSIKTLVATVPPLFAAGVRFIIAGAMLYLWSISTGVPHPTRREWRNLSILGALMFLAAYSGLFWAEKTMPSGVASVLVATIPVWTSIMEIFIFRKREMSWSFMAAILLGLAGIAILAFDPQGGAISLLACLAILGSEIAWSLGTVVTGMLSLPRSHLMSSGGQMMTGGAMLLLFSALAGELRPFPHFSAQAVGAMAYLIVAGSLIAFTAYQWLLKRMPATVVTSYAYVNPVVALAIGHWYGGESLGIRSLIGSALVLASVVAILRSRAGN